MGLLAALKPAILEEYMSAFIKKNTWVIPAIGFVLLIVAGIYFS